MHRSSDSETSSAGPEHQTDLGGGDDLVDPRTGINWGPRPQTDFENGRLKPEEWVRGDMDYLTRPYQESSPEPATDKDENDDDSD